MNIILTGEKHIGKSTLLRRILGNYPGSISGFRTFFDNRSDINSRALYMTDLYGNNSTKVVSWCDGKRTPDFSAFDKAGTSLLSQNSSLTVMDELGLFETEAHGFRDAVNAAFDRKEHVIAVIRLDARGWMGELKKRPDVKVFTISEENRDSLPDHILSLLK